MRPLLFQLSGISALLVLLGQLWSYASLERALIVTLVVGTAVYGVLLLGRSVARHIVNTPASEDATPSSAPASADASQPDLTSSMQSTS